MFYNYVVLEGKDLKSLIEEGLKKLDKEENQVEVEILEKGKFLMGIPIKDYKIKMTIKESEVGEIEKTLDSVKDIFIEPETFDLSFQEDGVYIVLNNTEKTDANIEKIISLLKKKEIKDLDINAVKDAFNNKMGTRIAPKQEKPMIDAELVLDVLADKLSAYITIVPPDGGRDLSISDALEIINKEIKYGLDVLKIEKLIKDRVYNTRTLIAKGTLPIHGQDGYVKYLFEEKKEIAPQILADGSADFRNLNLIYNVKAGDVLAELIPATSGKQGTSVIGEIINNKIGKEANFKYGKNVYLSEDGNKLIAECDGQVRLEEGKITVYEVYEVNGNVDNSTGNIKFNGTVRVKGSVLTGFQIIADGDVEVEGVVEGAEIKCNGNILLKRGIQGYNKSRLISKGSVTARYIENSYIEADGDITSDAIMHSEVTSKGNIRASGKNGLIVGGICRASQEIAAKTIGSSMATSTVLEVGVDPRLRIKQEETKNKLSEAENNIEKLDKTIVLLSRLAKSGELTPEKEDMLRKAIQTRNILTSQSDDFKKEINFIEAQIQRLSRGKIKAENVIYPGVKIVMGNSTMFIRDELSRSTIYKEHNELKIGPYER